MKWLRSILLIIIGALSIFLGSDILGMNTGNHVGNQEYGGDAYTGIQNAAAQTANNIQYLNRSLEEFATLMANWMGFLLITIGTLLLVVGVSKTISAFQKKPVEVVNEQATICNS